MIGLATTGQKATTESIKEFIYATEYEPAELPNTVQTGSSGDKAVPVEGLATGPTPSAWDTRNTGSTLEVEPAVAADGKTVSLRFIPEIVYHLGEHVWSEWRDLRGNADIRIPMFYTLRLNAAVTTVAGQPLLVAALSPKGEDGTPDPHPQGHGLRPLRRPRSAREVGTPVREFQTMEHTDEHG